MTGGFGLRMLGSEVFGGKKYIFVLCAILSYFALTAQRIQPRQVKWAVALFFLGGVTCFIGDLYSIMPSSLNFIFQFFSPSVRVSEGFDQGMYRLGGVAAAAIFVICYLLARYGIRGIFLSGKKGRLVVFALFFMLSLWGGYRGTVVGLAMLLAFQFFGEGLHRTKLLPILAVMGVVAMVVIIPLTSKLPFTVQRSLSVVPFLPVDAMAKADGEATMQWRYDLWSSLLPQVPKHLLLGKGYAITAEDFEMMGRDVAFKSVDPSQQGLALATDYHNGWLSVIIPFGLWGAIAFVWFIGAALWVMVANYRFSNPALQTVNTLLLALFIKTALMFFGGSLNSDMVILASLVGFSVSLNGGVRQPAPQPVLASKPTSPARLFPRQHPAFQRYRTGP
jgi:O-antigen ligase